MTIGVGVGIAVAVEVGIGGDPDADPDPEGGRSRMARQYPCRRFQGFVLLAVLCAGVAAAAVIDLTGDLEPHVGEWRVSDGEYSTVGEPPPGGWYVRSRRRYDLERLSFDVRRESPGGIVYVYTSHWRILLRSDSISVKANRLWAGQKRYHSWPFYFWTATRPIDFTSGTWHSFELVADGSALNVRFGGRPVLCWRSPAEEWETRVAESGKLGSSPPLRYPPALPPEAVRGKGETLVLHAWETPAGFRKLCIKGEDRGPAEGFYGKRLHDAGVKVDAELSRLAPREPVKVTWSLDDPESGAAARLPAVADWAVTETVDPAKHYGEEHGNVVRAVPYFVGSDQPGVFPNALFNHHRSYAFGARRLPDEVRIHFNLADAGSYTLQVEAGTWGIGFGPNVLEVLVDGKAVSREVYRALLQHYFGPGLRDYVPLELAAGPHRIDLRLSLELVEDIRSYAYLTKFMRLPLTRVALVRGVREPVTVVRAGDRSGSRSAEALRDPFSFGETYGKTVHYRIDELPGSRPVNLKLHFHEVDVVAPGQRLMDLFVNGRLVEEGLDVLARAGRRTPFELVCDTRPVGERSPACTPGWTPRVWGKGDVPRAAIVRDEERGAYVMRVQGVSGDNGVLADVAVLDQAAPAAVVLQVTGRIDGAATGRKRSMHLGLSLKPARWADGGQKWESFDHRMGLDPQQTGWQVVRHVWRPEKPVKSLAAFLRVPAGVTAWFGEVRAVPLREGQDPGEALKHGDNLVPNGDFEALSYHVDVKLVGRNFKAFLNGLEITDADGGILHRDNCGWSRPLSLKYRPPRYSPSRNVTPVPAAPVESGPDALFEGHNMVVNPRLRLREEDGRPRYWWSGSDLRKQLEPAPVLFYDILPGEGQYGHDAETGHNGPGSLRVGATAEEFGLVNNWPPVDYGKRQSFSVWLRSENATGEAFPEILWFAQDANSDLKWTDHGGFPLNVPRLRLLGRSTCPDRVTGTRDWTRLEVTARPPYGTSYAALVVRVESNTSGTVWIDDAEFPAGGTEPLELTHSHLGYHPLSDKQFVVRSFLRDAVTCRLLDAATGRTVREGRAEYHSHESFTRRHYWVFSLTGMRTPGRYRVEASQGATRVSTPEFRIAADVYRRLAQVCLNGIHAKRFNHDLPGFTEPGALEDAHMHTVLEEPRFARFETRYTGDVKDGLGGWFDAGDMIKHVEFWPGVLLAVYNASRYITPPLTDRGEDDALAEMLWGYRAFHKFQDPTGAFYTGVHPQMWATDNVPLFGGDRHMDSIRPLPQAAGMAALGAMTLRDVDPGLSRRYLDVAVKSFAREFGEDDPDDMLLASKRLFAAIYLWKLTGREKWQRVLDRDADAVARGLAQKAYAGSEELYSSNLHVGGITQDFVAVPCLFLELLPEHPAAGRIRQGLRSFAVEVARVSDLSPWGQARHIPASDEERPARFFSSFRRTGYWSALAYSLSQIGMLLADETIIRLAERQLQWLLGKNFVDVCTVHGVSDRVWAGGDYLFFQAEFFGAWLASDRRLLTYDGLVPTAAFRLNPGVKLRKGHDYFPPVEGYPTGVPQLYLQADYPVHPGPSEFYLPLTADVLNAAAGVHAALAWLDRHR